MPPVPNAVASALFVREQGITFGAVMGCRNVSYNVGEIIYRAFDNHPPKAMVGNRVTCACGVTTDTGQRYLEHLASMADGEIHTARYKMTDPSGQPVPSNFGR